MMLSYYLRDHKYQTRKLREKLQRKIAWILPRSIVMWCFVRVVAHATTGEYSNQIVPELTAIEALDRWDKVQYETPKEYER